MKLSDKLFVLVLIILWLVTLSSCHLLDKF
jgi:hypothetical protein